MTSKIYTAADWQIYTYTPEPGSFVLDFSQLDGSDVLGTTEGSLEATPFEIAEIVITEGSAPEYGIFLAVTPSSMSVQLQAKDFSLEDVNSFYVGTLIQATSKFPVAANITTDEITQFYGIIESVAVAINPGEDFSTISIQASAISQNVINSSLAITKDETTAKGTLINAAATAQNINIECDPGSYNYKGTALENKSVGEWLTDLAICDFMQFVDYPRFLSTYNAGLGKYVISTYNYPQMNVTNTVGSSAATFTADDLIAVELDWSGAGSPTGVTLTNYTDSSIIYQYGSTESDAGGSFSYQTIVDLKNLTQMTTVGQQMLSMTKSFRPVSITVPIASTYETLEFRTSVLATFPSTVYGYIYPKNLHTLSSTITIDLPNYGINDLPMLIVGRTMTVTPDTWTTTYNLWKGFTN